MEKKLENYILVFNKIIPDKICEQTVKELKKEKSWNQHKFYFYNEDKTETMSGNQELFVSFNTQKTQSILNDKVGDAINHYIKIINTPWFTSCKGFAPIRFNKYSSKNKSRMAEHCDHIHSIFPGEIKGIPILSIVGNLNDNYKGGKFIMFGDKEIKLGKGDILVFPSIFLYPHRVDPVFKGDRYSFVSWAF